MKILVIDDNPIHQQAARDQFGKDHELTVACSYDEGLCLLEPNIDQFGSWSYGENRSKRDFEIVLVDLLMPASSLQQGNGGRRYVGQEMPIGIFLALLAAKKGAKWVSVFTDSNHHDHPASACFDPFNQDGSLPSLFPVGTATMMLCNTDRWVREGVKRWDWVVRYLLSPPPAGMRYLERQQWLEKLEAQD